MYEEVVKVPQAILKLVLEDPTFIDHVSTTCYSIDYVRGLASELLDPWTLPTLDEVDTLEESFRRTLPDGEFEKVFRYWMGPVRHSWRTDISSFSATSAAIAFLKRYPSTRNHIRRIVLIEDRPSIMNPAQHAHGLIPLCRENPRLRIEHRVKIWQLANERSYLPSYSYHHLEDLAGTWQIGVFIMRWIAEVPFLHRAGMPPSSCESLTLPV